MRTIYLKCNFILLLMLCSCTYKNPIERNKIVFENVTVEDSLVKLLKLLPKLVKSNNDFLTNYYFEDNKFYVNSSYIGKIDSLKIDSIKDFKNYSEKEKRSFISLAKFLNKNHLNSGYFDKSINHWSFNYRALSQESFNDAREIVFCNEIDSLQFKSWRIILDRKSNIFLLAPKDAIIR